MPTIRRFDAADWPAVWGLLAPVFGAGDTYAVAPDVDEADAHRLWIDVPAATYVVEADDGALIGTYYLKPNQAGGGAHVCNCGYIVGAAARGRGVATAMCEHSQREAVNMGFRAMQFNLVVSTNETAVRLWQRQGFAIVGRLPGAFLHPTRGTVDAFVMFKQLASGSG